MLLLSQLSFVHICLSLVWLLRVSLALLFFARRPFGMTRTPCPQALWYDAYAVPVGPLV